MSPSQGEGRRSESGPPLIMEKKETKEPLEAKFSAVKDELVRQIGKKHEDLVVIASNKEDGISRALTLAADGQWEVQIDMSGYRLGQNPRLMRILTELAEIINKEFRQTGYEEYQNGHNQAVTQQREEYLLTNKDQLLEGLTGMMEARLSELRS